MGNEKKRAIDDETEKYEYVEWISKKKGRDTDWEEVVTQERE